MPQSIHRFSYVYNNPIRYTDPSGYGIKEELEKLAEKLSKPHQAVLGFVYRDSANRVDAAYDWIADHVPGEHLKTSYQTFGIAVDWFLETDDEGQSFGPDEPVTKALMRHDAIRAFREEWAKVGYRLPFTWQHRLDVREGPLIPRALAGVTKYQVANLEMCLAMHPYGALFSQIEATGGVLGSLDRISVRDAGSGKVLFEVYNVTGWASGTRIPGTESWVIPNQPRSNWGPGGTIEQLFYWVEDRYQGGGGSGFE